MSARGHVCRGIQHWPEASGAQSQDLWMEDTEESSSAIFKDAIGYPVGLGLRELRECTFPDGQEWEPGACRCAMPATVHWLYKDKGAAWCRPVRHADLYSVQGGVQSNCSRGEDSMWRKTADTGRI